VPPTSNDRVVLDVVAMNKDNYETGLLKLVIVVTPPPNKSSPATPVSSVRLKIDNLNLVNLTNYAGATTLI
jgi:hypothetical protein